VGDEVPFSPTITSVGDTVFSSVGIVGDTVGDDVASSVSNVDSVGDIVCSMLGDTIGDAGVGGGA
jgi:hypothetical protein